MRGEGTNRSRVVSEKCGGYGFSEKRKKGGMQGRTKIGGSRVENMTLAKRQTGKGKAQPPPQ